MALICLLASMSRNWRLTQVAKRVDTIVTSQDHPILEDTPKHSDRTDLAQTRASWPFDDDDDDDDDNDDNNNDDDDVDYFDQSKSSSLVKTDGMGANGNKCNYRKWDLIALREYFDSPDGSSPSGASPTVIKKGILAPVKVRPSLHHSSAHPIHPKKDRRSVRFSEVVDVYPLPFRKELAVCRINKEHAIRAVATVQTFRRMPNDPVLDKSLSMPTSSLPSFNESLQQHLIPISSSDDSFEEDEDAGRKMSAEDRRYRLEASDIRKQFEERKPTQISLSPPLETPYRLSKKRPLLSSELDTDHGRQPMKKKAKNEASSVNAEQVEWPVVVDSKQEMKELLDKHCSTISDRKHHSQLSQSSQRATAESLPLKHRLTTQAPNHQLYKKSIEGRKEAMTASALVRIRPTSSQMHALASHRRTQMNREVERQKQQRDRERAREWNANRQQTREKYSYATFLFNIW